VKARAGVTPALSRRMLLKRSIGLLMASTAAALALAGGACGGNDSDKAAPGLTVPALGQLQAQPEPVQQLDAALTEPKEGVIEVSAENASFQPNRLSVPIGQAVTIRVANKDGQPHSLRIAGPDGQYETEDDAVTEPPTIGGGETAELTFAPQVAGAYTFRCDVHPGSMGGQIVVQ